MFGNRTTNRKKNWLKGAIFFVLILACLYGVFAAGYIFGQKGKPIAGIGPKNVINTAVGEPEGIDFSLYWEAWNKLKVKAVTVPDTQKMIYGSISGMFSALDDPYTVFFTPDENKQFQEDIQGEFEGIGVEIVMKDGFPTVVAPLSDTPAEKAGLKPNDIIIEVDDAKTADLGFQETINRIRGKDGTKVTLKVVRQGKDEPLVLEITREKITVKSVTWEKKNIEGKSIFVVKVRQFGDDTAQLFADFVDEASASNAGGIIIDLRNNPGGYLETAIDLSSYFLDGGVVVSEKNRDGVSKEYKVTKKDRLRKFKTAILVNGGSASASEIFAGALQDRKAGTLVGEKTFGKGSVQELVELSDGSALKITIAKWLTPNGRMINGEGITPDIVIANDENNSADAQLNRAFDYIAKGN